VAVKRERRREGREGGLGFDNKSERFDRSKCGFCAERVRKVAEKGSEERRAGEEARRARPKQSTLH
jgi:hypothetical protein